MGCSLERRNCSTTSRTPTFEPIRQLDLGEHVPSEVNVTKGVLLDRRYRLRIAASSREHRDRFALDLGISSLHFRLQPQDRVTNQSVAVGRLQVRISFELRERQQCILYKRKCVSKVSCLEARHGCICQQTHTDGSQADCGQWFGGSVCAEKPVARCVPLATFGSANGRFAHRVDSIDGAERRHLGYRVAKVAQGLGAVSNSTMEFRERADE